MVVQSLWFERHLLLLVLVLDAAVAGVAGGVLGEAGAIRVLGLLVKTVHFAGAVEDRWVGFLKLLEDLLAMLELHQGWGKGLDGVEDFLLQVVVADDQESLLEDVVAELVVDQLLDDEMHSGLEVT